jgi:hypothetical protein
MTGSADSQIVPDVSNILLGRSAVKSTPTVMFLSLGYISMCLSEIMLTPPGPFNAKVWPAIRFSACAWISV